MKLELLTLSGLARQLRQPKTNVHRLHASGLIPHDFEADSGALLFDPARVESLRAIVINARKGFEPEVTL